MKSLKIKNFMKHKNLSLEFEPGLNLITGPSSTGKSCILKAIRWFYLNQPSGFAYKNNDVKRGKVVVEIDGMVKERSSSNSGVYKINGQEYKALGGKVPIDFGITELNFINQLNPYWFFNLSGSERSSFLYDLVGLENINEILDNIKNERNKIRGVYRVKKSEFEKVKAEKQALKKVPELVKKFNQFELLKKISEIKIPVVPSLDRLIALNEKRLAIELELAILKKLNKIKVVEVPNISRLKSISKQYSLLKRLSKVKIKPIPKIPDISEYRKIKFQIELCKLKNKIAEYQLLINDRKDELREIWNSLERCPLCQRKL